MTRTANPNPRSGLIWASRVTYRRGRRGEGIPQYATIGLVVVDAVVVDGPPYAVGAGIIDWDGDRQETIAKDARDCWDDLVRKGWQVKWTPVRTTVTEES